MESKRTQVVYFVLGHCIILLTCLILNFHSSTADNERSVRSIPYNGEWDISAKTTAILCEAINRTPNSIEDDTPINEPAKETYTKDGQCWKNKWIPCEGKQKDDRLGKDGILSKRRKPCGYYKMVAVPVDEC